MPSKFYKSIIAILTQNNDYYNINNFRRAITNAKNIRKFAEIMLYVVLSIINMLKWIQTYTFMELN